MSHAGECDEFLMAKLQFRLEITDKNQQSRVNFGQLVQGCSRRLGESVTIFASQDFKSVNCDSPSPSVEKHGNNMGFKTMAAGADLQ